jgi:hypothetical protein
VWKFDRDRLSPSRLIGETTSKISPYKVSEKRSFSFISGILRKLLPTFDTIVETTSLALSFHWFTFPKQLLSKSFKFVLISPYSLCVKVFCGQKYIYKKENKNVCYIFRESASWATKRTVYFLFFSLSFLRKSFFFLMTHRKNVFFSTSKAVNSVRWWARQLQFSVVVRDRERTKGKKSFWKSADRNRIYGWNTYKNWLYKENTIHSYVHTS